MQHSGANFQAYQHQTIWDETQFGPGVASYDATARGWAAVATRLEDVKAFVNATVGGIRETRTGVASDAAAVAMTPLGAWVEGAQQLAVRTADAIETQAAGFTTTRAAIPPVVEIPEEKGFGGLPGIDSFTTSDHEKAEKAAANAEQIARDRMSSFQSTSNMTLATVPEFAPLAPSEGSLGGPGVQSVGAVGGGSSGGYAPGGGGGHPVGTAPAAASAPPGGPGVASPQPSVGTTGQSYSPTGGEYQRSAPVAPAASAGGPPAGLVAPGQVAGAGGGGRAGGAGGGGGRGGARGGFGGGAPRGAAGPPSAPSGPGSAGQGGGMSGSGAAAGARGGGMAPMGGGAGRGRGDDDTEHERPTWLIEEDPNAIVGQLDPVAPPVIGRPEWQTADDGSEK